MILYQKSQTHEKLPVPFQLSYFRLQKPNYILGAHSIADCEPQREIMENLLLKPFGRGPSR